MCSCSQQEISRHSLFMTPEDRLSPWSLIAPDRSINSVHGSKARIAYMCIVKTTAIFFFVRVLTSAFHVSAGIEEFPTLQTRFIILNYWPGFGIGLPQSNRSNSILGCMTCAPAKKTNVQQLQNSFTVNVESSAIKYRCLSSTSRLLKNIERTTRSIVLYLSTRIIQRLTFLTHGNLLTGTSVLWGHPTLANECSRAWSISNRSYNLSWWEMFRWTYRTLPPGTVSWF